MAVYGIFGFFAGQCQCNLLQFGRVYGLGTFIGGVLAGAFVGGAIGCLIGIAELEENDRLYIQGVRIGGKVVLIQTENRNSEKVKHILEQEHASGVKIFKRKGSDELFIPKSNVREILTIQGEKGP